MIISGKVHCFFEQSGTFKNEFIKLGIPAEDYDIQNNFGQTDHIVDLFKAIDDAYDGKPSLFDNIGGGDLIMAFYPCIYFSCLSQLGFYMSYKNYKRLSNEDKIKEILKRSDKRKEFYDRLIKFCAVCLRLDIRMIFENPWSLQTYLKANFIKQPDLIDDDRTKRGDAFVKPTAYWYWNCEPTNGQSFQEPKETKRLMWCKKNPIAGQCSEERSMISPDYARNFICDFILGREQPELDPQTKFEF
jgi:hypothetical protein